MLDFSTKQDQDDALGLSNTVKENWGKQETIHGIKNRLVAVR